jgi:hypothetical protein
MAILRHLSVDRVRVLIGGLGLIVLSGTPVSLAAQVGRGGAVLVAKSDSGSIDLPDAPMPAALAGRDSGTGFSSSAQDAQQQDKQQPKPGEQSPQTPPGALPSQILG